MDSHTRKLQRRMLRTEGFHPVGWPLIVVTFAVVILLATPTGSVITAVSILSAPLGGAGPAPRIGTSKGHSSATVSSSQHENSSSIEPTHETTASASWSELAASGGPPARTGAAMAYDGKDGYVLLFGGCSGCTTGSSTGVLADTWAWADGVWTQLHPSISPPARNGATMTYDAADGYVVLFGGCCNTTTGGSFGDTWVFSGGTWTQISSTQNPPPRMLEQMSYDASMGKVVLFGGCGGINCGAPTLADTWAFSKGEWSNITSSTGSTPPATQGGSICDDEADGYIVLFGGDDQSSGLWLYYTWKFESGQWSNISGSVGTYPYPRVGAQMVYDPTGECVLYGGYSARGYNYVELSDTWLFRGGHWTNVTPLESPSGRHSYGLAPDPLDGYSVLFGGSDGTNDLGDTWAFNSGVPGPLTITSFSVSPPHGPSRGNYVSQLNSQGWESALQVHLFQPSPGMPVS